MAKRKQGRPRMFGRKFQCSAKPSDIVRIRAWARADKVSVSQILAELIATETLRRDGHATLVLNGA